MDEVTQLANRVNELKQQRDAVKEDNRQLRLELADLKRFLQLQSSILEERAGGIIG